MSRHVRVRAQPSGGATVDAAVRVIAGRLGGRRLAAVPQSVRPTADRVREAIFSRLGDLDGVRTLDLYAGTGALGIEALSRGADHATFVDRAPKAVAVVRANLNQLELCAYARVMRADAVAALRRLARDAARFDLVFVDPPYASDEMPSALAALAASGAVDSQTLVVAESATRHALDCTAEWTVENERHYGDTLVRQLRLAPSSDSQRGRSCRR